MRPEGITPGPHAPDAEVMASVDQSGHDEQLVIADISADGEWVSMPTTHTAPLSAWR